MSDGDRETRAHPTHDRLGRGVDHPGHREIHDSATLRSLIGSGRRLTGWRMQGLDLTPHAEDLSGVDVRGLVVLGGEVPADLATDLVARGAVLVPQDSTCPVDPFRSRLYSAEELYAGLDDGGYDVTPDARAHAWGRLVRTQHDAWATLLRAMHDDAIQDALVEALHGREVVGVMGGHALGRGGSDYADTAHLGHLLAGAGRVVITGGGPGAMEAANLGALSPSIERLDAALVELAAVPSFHPSVDDWARLALEVRAGLIADRPAQVSSIGVPTWFYGHEPPNVFCDGIAKYFSNALREDILLAQSTGGLVVLPGAAGTVQEIFQAATPLYYAEEDAPVPPLVLVGLEHWSETVPVWSALRSLAIGRPLERALHLVDTPEEAAEIVVKARLRPR